MTVIISIMKVGGNDLEVGCVIYLETGGGNISSLVDCGGLVLGGEKLAGRDFTRYRWFNPWYHIIFILNFM